MPFEIRRWPLICSSIIVVFLAFAAIRYEYTFYERAYEHLPRGTTKADVLKRFGKPQQMGDCRYSTPTWDDEPADKIAMTCVQTFEYSSRVRIGEWVIGFDGNGRVVSKAYLSSP
jgi:hypothetical protein